jgi:hypothetical protein
VLRALSLLIESRDVVLAMLKPILPFSSLSFPSLPSELLSLPRPKKERRELELGRPLMT